MLFLREVAEAPFRVLITCGSNTPTLSSHRTEEQGPPPVAAINVPGVPLHLPGTVIASSGNVGANTPMNMLDGDSNSVWQTPQATNQFATIQLTGGERLIDRVQFFALGFQPTCLKTFAIQVSKTTNPADFVSVLTGVYVNNSQQQEFVVPGGAVRAQFVKLIVIDNYGAGTTTIATFNIVSLGNFDNVATLTATNNVALAESIVVDQRRKDHGFIRHVGPQRAEHHFAVWSNGDGWQADVNNNAFAVIELAGGKTYTVEGVRLSGGVKDFEVWVSNTTTEATTFTRVLAASQTGSSVISRFLFPGRTGTSALCEVSSKRAGLDRSPCPERTSSM